MDLGGLKVKVSSGAAHAVFASQLLLTTEQKACPAELKASKQLVALFC